MSQLVTQFNKPGRVISDYMALVKPRIVMLLLLTALSGMFLATGGTPDPLLTILVLGAGALSSGGAHAINHYLDRDIDALMIRTRNRPISGGRISPVTALIMGAVLNVIGFVVLAFFVNITSALLTLSATLFYVFVYTIGLKRVTPQNIVIVGAAGAIPPLVGWVAVTGDITLAAVYLPAIIFLWTPPHFWALSLMMKDDYARARVPMLPVVSGVHKTKIHIFLYTVVLVAFTLIFSITQTVGWIYFCAAVALGVVFLYYVWRLLSQSDIKGAKNAYVYSILYLAALFVAVMVDSVIVV